MKKKKKKEAKPVACQTQAFRKKNPSLVCLCGFFLPCTGG